MFHLFRAKRDNDEIDDALRRNDAAHDDLIAVLRQLLEERNAHGPDRRPLWRRRDR